MKHVDKICVDVNITADLKEAYFIESKAKSHPCIQRSDVT